MEAFAEKLKGALKRPEAADVSMGLYSQYVAVYGAVPSDIEHILADIAALEEDKLAAREYVRQKGVMEDFVQGKQRIKRENKCVKMFAHLAQAQTRLIASLKLSAGNVPEESGGNAGGDDDGFDNF